MSLLRQMLGLGRNEALDAELFGVEIEAEGLSANEAQRLHEGAPLIGRRLARIQQSGYWGTTRDGSLRNGGIELVSIPLTADAMELALDVAGAALDARELGVSARTGIHVHVNCRHLTFESWRGMMATYALIEPLLFQCAGVARSQSIYCVPWAEGRNEPAMISAAIREAEEHAGFLRPALRNSCKYSALFCGPLLTFGTVEFRHAPTWANSVSILNWFRVVRDASRMRLSPEDPYWRDRLQVQVGRVWHGFPLDWDAYDAAVKRWGLVTMARSFLPCTYKVKSWGRAAGQNIPPNPLREPEMLEPAPAPDAAGRPRRGLATYHELRLAPDAPDLETRGNMVVNMAPPAMPEDFDEWMDDIHHDDDDDNEEEEE